MKEKLLNKFKASGFEHVSINMWNDRYIYANIKGLTTVSFDMEKSFGKRAFNCYINVKDKIDKNSFARLIPISYYIREHADEIKAFFSEVSYITNK